MSRSTFYFRTGGGHLDLEHIRIDVQTDIGDVLKMLAANKPHDFGNLAFGIIAARKGLPVELLILCQVRQIVQRSAPWRIDR